VIVQAHRAPRNVSHPLAIETLMLLAGLVFAAALLYTSVGHAGASGYIAAMALVGMSPVAMKPTALALNILVAAFATLRWTRNTRDLNWGALLPLTLASIPAAYIGGTIQLSDSTYKLLVGIILLAAGLKFLLQPRPKPTETDQPTAVPWTGGLATGGIVGILSGITGTGGGIFLSPLLLLFGWAGTRQASGIVAPFILVNSIAALIGNARTLPNIPIELPWLIIAALSGALLGTRIGISWVSNTTLQRILGVVLLIAAAKFLLT
jgi:uncharacterized protein